jgi:hypothetical protein
VNHYFDTYFFDELNVAQQILSIGFSCAWDKRLSFGLVAIKCPNLQALFVSDLNMCSLDFTTLLAFRFTTLEFLSLHLASCGGDFEPYFACFPVLQWLVIRFPDRLFGSLLDRPDFRLFGVALPRSLTWLDLDPITPVCLETLLRHVTLQRLMIKSHSGERTSQFASLFYFPIQHPLDVYLNDELVVLNGKLCSWFKNRSAKFLM